MFYVSQIRDSKYRIIAGPFVTKRKAESEVKAAKAKVIAADAWSHFDAFGVCCKPDKNKFKKVLDKSNKAR